MPPTIAFLGLGTMGSPMAARIAQAGFAIRVWNRTKGRDGAARAVGASVAESPVAAARDADLVVAMLTGAEAVESAWFGASGAASADVRGKLFVDMSTSGPLAARDFAARLAASGASFVDAPVSGTRAPAERGELVVLTGGEPGDVERAQPLFASVGRRTIHAGGVGAGQALKVILNGLGCQHLMAFASMLRLGERAGLSREVLVETFTSSAFATPAYVGKRERVLAGDYERPDFVLELVLRDAVLCAEMQAAAGLQLPTHRAAHAEVRRAVEQGLGGKDLFAVERLYSS